MQPQNITLLWLSNIKRLFEQHVNRVLAHCGCVNEFNSSFVKYCASQSKKALLRTVETVQFHIQFNKKPSGLYHRPLRRPVKNIRREAKEAREFHKTYQAVHDQ